MSSQSSSTAPPAPPPKAIDQDTSAAPPPPTPEPNGPSRPQSQRPFPANQTQQQDPGDQWLPQLLQDKSKQDLAEILSSPDLLNALTHAAHTAHPSTHAAEEPLLAALAENIALASRLNEMQSRVAALRATTQTQLLAANALERQWRDKQSEMDRALAPFSPSSLYQRLNQGVQEQEMMCRALEESFLEGRTAWERDGDVASEREVGEWVRRYRDGKRLYYLRKERKDRWDEGRVGGWR